MKRPEILAISGMAYAGAYVLLFSERPPLLLLSAAVLLASVISAIFPPSGTDDSRWHVAQSISDAAMVMFGFGFILWLVYEGKATFTLPTEDRVAWLSLKVRFGKASLHWLGGSLTALAAGMYFGHYLDDSPLYTIFFALVGLALLTIFVL